MGTQFLLLPVKMLLLLSCLAATSLASPLQFERVPILDNSLPLLVQDRVPNPCLTKANDTCIFPFTYNGVEYYRCTYADSPTPWCATMVDPNNTVVTNRWGDCSTSQFSNCPEDTPDLPSCTAESGASCVFPFRHEGITYNSCASTNLLSSAWCSHNNNHHHINHHNRIHFHNHHSVRPCIRKALRVPVHLAGQDLHLVHQGGRRAGQALVLHQ